jgi:hypothetical protein
MKTTTSLTNTVNVPQTTVRSANLHSRRAAKSNSLWTRALVFGGLLGLSSGLLTPAQAQFGPPAGTQFVQKYVDFKTTNQSMWDANHSAGIGFSYPFTKSWNTGSQKAGAYSSKISTGGEVDASCSGTVGFEFDTIATYGSVDVDYNCNILLVPPTALKPGQAFTIPSYWGYSGNMTTHSPQASISLVGIASGSANLTIKGKVAGKDVINQSWSPSIDENWQLLDMSSGSLGGDIDIKGKGILTGEAHVPTINTQGSNGSGTDGSGKVVYPAITSTGSDDFLTLDGDVTRLITTLMEDADIPVPPLKDDESFNFTKLGSGTKGKYGYNFLDLYGELSLTAQQDFAFSAKPMITLAFYWGGKQQMTASFPAGTTYQGTLPASVSGPVSVVATADIAQNTFTNHTNLIINPGLYFLPMDAYLNVDLLVFGKSSNVINQDLQPVAPIDLISHAFPVSIYSQQFTLGGFTPQQLPGFTINISN